MCCIFFTQSETGSTTTQNGANIYIYHNEWCAMRLNSCILMIFAWDFFIWTYYLFYLFYFMTCHITVLHIYCITCHPFDKISNLVVFVRSNVLLDFHICFKKLIILIFCCVLFPLDFSIFSKVNCFNTVILVVTCWKLAFSFWVMCLNHLFLNFCLDILI